MTQPTNLWDYYFDELKRIKCMNCNASKEILFEHDGDIMCHQCWQDTPIQESEALTLEERQK